MEPLQLLPTTGGEERRGGRCCYGEAFIMQEKFWPHHALYKNPLAKLSKSTVALHVHEMRTWECLDTGFNSAAYCIGTYSYVLPTRKWSYCVRCTLLQCVTPMGLLPRPVNLRTEKGKKREKSEIASSSHFPKNINCICDEKKWTFYHGEKQGLFSCILPYSRETA